MKMEYVQAVNSGAKRSPISIPDNYSISYTALIRPSYGLTEGHLDKSVLQT